MAGPATPRVSLGQLSTRLIRSLGLAGVVNPDLRNELSSIVLADDATRPGCNETRNRAFAGTQGFTGVGGAFVGTYFVARAPVIIDLVTVQAQWDLNTVPPTNDTGAYTTLAAGRASEITIPAGLAGGPAVFQERPGLEAGPLTVTQSGGVPAGFGELAQAQIITGLAPIAYPPTRIFLDVGDAFAVWAIVSAGVAGVDGLINYAGRLF
jgi:hypothetical protein